MLNNSPEIQVPETVLTDIDGVLLNLAPSIIAAINKEYGTGYMIEDWDNWHWPVEQLATLANMEPSRAANWLFSVKHMREPEPDPKAQQVLKDWAEQGSKISVVTSRSSGLGEITHNWLGEHFPFIDPDRVFIRGGSDVSGHEFKKRIAEAIQPDVYFEDEPYQLLYLLEYWSEHQLAIIKLIDQVWNRNFSELNQFRTNWAEVELEQST